MKIFLTSDCFFGRRKIAIERGFIDENEMFNSYIQNWNDRVSDKDIVYHLGNFSWDPVFAESALNLLNGKIYFFQSFYDSHLIEASQVIAKKHFVVQNQILMSLKEEMVLSPWPLLDWPGKSNGIIHVHGGDISSDQKNGFRWNANISYWNHAPIELEFLKELSKINLSE